MRYQTADSGFSNSQEEKDSEGNKRLISLHCHRTRLVHNCCCTHLRTGKHTWGEISLSGEAGTMPGGRSRHTRPYRPYLSLYRSCQRQTVADLIVGKEKAVDNGVESVETPIL